MTTEQESSEKNLKTLSDDLSVLLKWQIDAQIIVRIHIAKCYLQYSAGQRTDIRIENVANIMEGRAIK